MGITPVTNLFPLTAASSIPADLDVMPLGRMERSPRSGDETYSSNSGRFARDTEDDAPEDSTDDFDDDPSEVLYTSPGERTPPTKISFFA
jgi:hypothetical protein